MKSAIMIKNIQCSNKNTTKIENFSKDFFAVNQERKMFQIYYLTCSVFIRFRTVFPSNIIIPESEHIGNEPNQ